MLKFAVALLLLTLPVNGYAQEAPHLQRIERFAPGDLFTPEQRQLLITLVQDRHTEQGGGVNPLQEALLHQLKAGAPLNMAELTALAAIMLTSHNDEALALRYPMLEQIQKMRGERKYKGPRKAGEGVRQ